MSKPEGLGAWGAAVAGLLGGFAIAAAAMYESKQKRRERAWAAAESEQRLFHLRMGYANARDPDRFLRKYAGFPAATQPVRSVP